MKRNVVIFSVLSLFTILAVVPLSLAQSDQDIDPRCRTWYRRVTTQGGVLNVRENTATNARIRGTVANGTVVLFNTADRSGNWSEITAPGRLTGWVADRFLTYHHYGNRRFTGTMQVKTLEGGPVNLRSPSGDVIGSVPNGTLVTTENHTVGYFANVTTPEGRQGQIVTQFLICN
ncbi:SH3 domain-containing protein [Laspinema olomoucense]|uniref:SH3 domain-containing protein n=1 Tax=Laspinema olomoucense TaxID=3231600 RepID=UPI0021BA9F73|nr:MULTISPECIES: SH3 domain-containing protein [unclassified Laspinema]MCT7972875.1 SH3 domain-containing protein [Laspinema sp. D3d]MCT7991187.1 SH3 domain-containing protein [Laspinema sp. D3a]